MNKTKASPTSLPPTALVRMTAEETGGGMQPTTCKLMGVVNGCGQTTKLLTLAGRRGS